MARPRGRKTGGTSQNIRPFQGRTWLAGAFSGGVAPGYLIDPLRGSRLDGTGEFFRSLFSPAVVCDALALSPGRVDRDRRFPLSQSHLPRIQVTQPQQFPGFAQSIVELHRPSVTDGNFSEENQLRRVE
jgi:hypothetical protein